MVVWCLTFALQIAVKLGCSVCVCVDLALLPDWVGALQLSVHCDFLPAALSTVLPFPYSLFFFIY